MILQENIMFDIFCYFVVDLVLSLELLLSPSSSSSSSSSLLLLEFMVYVCLLFIGFYVHSRATKTSKTGNRRGKKTKTKQEEDATFLGMFCMNSLYMGPNVSIRCGAVVSLPVGELNIPCAHAQHIQM